MVKRAVTIIFQSTLPVWGGTRRPSAGFVLAAISIHPPREGRDALQPGKLLFRPISIHPPRVGRDQTGYGGHQPNAISIHPPRGGRDEMDELKVEGFYKFQSTLPVWGGTNPEDVVVRSHSISIHPPHVGRDI